MKLLSFILLICGSICLYAQEDTIYVELNLDSLEIVDSLELEDSEETILEDPLISASYPFGEEEMMKFVRDSLIYPESISPETRGCVSVVIQFYVLKDGSLDRFVCIRGDPMLCESLINAFKKMPKWNPAMLAGEPVEDKWTFPMYIRIE